MAHHNSLGIRRQLKIRHLYGTVNFSTQCINLYGDQKLACLPFFVSFVERARPLRRKLVFAVASIAGIKTSNA